VANAAKTTEGVVAKEGEQVPLREYILLGFEFAGTFLWIASLRSQ
jgi:hypothetical protein